jgi:putative transposase
MSEKCKFWDPLGTYFVTLTTVGWADIFTRPDHKQVVIRSLRHCQKEKGLLIHAWCLMTSHLHTVISKSGEPLPAILRDFKKFTARELFQYVDSVHESRREWMTKLFFEAGEDLRRISNFKVWQDGNHPILLTKPKFTRQKIDYIHNNPVIEELVTEAEHYLYSSAGDYGLNRKGYLEIDFIRT